MRTYTPTKTKIKLAVTFAALLSLAMAFDSNAQTIIATSQKWSDFGTTGFAAVPTTSTDIVINNGVTLQVDVTNAVCRDFTIGSSSSSNATLEFISANGSESKLTVGTTSAARDMYARGTANITFTNPSILVMTDDFSYTSGSGHKYVLNPGTGTIELKGSTTLNSDLNTFHNLIINAGSSTVTLGDAIEITGYLTVNSPFNANEKRVTMNGTIAQLISGSVSSITFEDITIANTSAIVSTNKNIILGNSDDLTINAGAVFMPAAGNVISGNNGSSNITGFGKAVVTSALLTSSTDDFASQYTLTKNISNMTIEFAGSSTQKIGTRTFKNVIVSSGTTLEVYNDITVNGDLTVNGDFLHMNKTITMNGSASQTIGGSASPSFYSLVVNNVNDITLATNITVTNGVTLTAGKIDLGNNNLVMSSGSSIAGASSTKYIKISGTGKLRAALAASTPYQFPVGYNPYLPVTITSPTATNFEVSVSEGALNSSNLPVSSNAVKNTWVINAPSVSSSTQINDINVTLGWVAGQNLPGYNPANSFMLMRETGTYTSINGTTPTDISGSGIGASDYIQTSGAVITMNGSTLYSFVIGDGSSNFGTNVPLPVEFISFTATKQSNEMAMLNFATAWEINNAGFEVERSTNGISWNNIGFVAGNGNSTEINNYAFPTSLANISAPVVYYRLKQVDFNGQFEYSATRTLRLSATAAAATSVYPNPATSRISVSLEGIAAGEMAKISVMDMSGKILISANQVVEEGNFTMDMNIDNLTKGNYIVNIASPSANYNTKLVKF